MAQQVLTSLKEHPDAWTRVDTMLEYSSDNETKYYALQILEHVIKTRWKALPRPQCEGRSQIVIIQEFIVKATESSNACRRLSRTCNAFVRKLNV